VPKPIIIIASAFLFTVLGLATGTAVNLLRPETTSTNPEFTVLATVLPTAGGALFGACVGAAAVGIGSRGTPPKN
jgi:hypothetical protein